MRKQLTFEEKLEQKLYCFGGGGGGGGGGDGAARDKGQAGPAAGDPGRSPSSQGGNTYNFNQVSKADQARGMNYEKVLDNGVVVQDFSTPFGGMARAA